MDERSDNELMLLLRGESREALGTLFARHHRSVYALCYRMTGDTAVADDLAQESFLRLLRYKENFDGRSLFTTWLYRVVRNLCLDHLSRRKRERRMQERLSLETEDGDVDGAPDDRVELLERALYALDPDKREVIVLSRFQGLNYREIAQVLECSVGAVKTRAHRALRELRAAFQKLEQEA